MFLNDKFTQFEQPESRICKRRLGNYGFLLNKESQFGIDEFTGRDEFRVDSIYSGISFYRAVYAKNICC